MFRTSNCSSPGGVLYKQLTALHLERSLVIDMIRYHSYHVNDYTPLKMHGEVL